MARRYTSAYMQLVWAVNGRASLIDASWREEVEAMIVWWLTHYKHKSIAVRAMPDHAHLLFEYHPTQSISQLNMVVKGEVTKFIKQAGLCEEMDWQDGYGLFTYHHDVVPVVKRYIQNQDAHHAGEARFRDEYREMLRRAGQSFEEWLLFEDMHDWLGEEVALERMLSTPGR